jgi:hypothetical protein
LQPASGWVVRSVFENSGMHEIKGPNRGGLEPK